jgi:hypothetical protein
MEEALMGYIFIATGLSIIFLIPHTNNNISNHIASSRIQDLKITFYISVSTGMFLLPN